nr:extensin family protein [Siccirubricoccus soli]
MLIGVALLSLRYLPPEWDPRAPLNLDAPPNPVTDLKLWWLSQSPSACFAAFTASDIPVVRAPDRLSDSGCEVENAVLLPAGSRVVPRSPLATCRLAAAWTLFERNTLQPAARLHLGAEVAEVRHLGTYNCRNVNHAAAGRRSEHASANAIDVAAFVLSSGRQVSVARDWPRPGPEAAFLRAVRDGACRWFNLVLGPDYNAAHQNHFHVDMGRWRGCR